MDFMNYLEGKEKELREKIAYVKDHEKFINYLGQLKTIQEVRKKFKNYKEEME